MRAIDDALFGVYGGVNMVAVPKFSDAQVAALMHNPSRFPRCLPPLRWIMVDTRNRVETEIDRKPCIHGVLVTSLD